MSTSDSNREFSLKLFYEFYRDIFFTSIHGKIHFVFFLLGLIFMISMVIVSDSAFRFTLKSGSTCVNSPFVITALAKLVIAVFCFLVMLILMFTLIFQSPNPDGQNPFRYGLCTTIIYMTFFPSLAILIVCTFLPGLTPGLSISSTNGEVYFCKYLGQKSSFRVVLPTNANNSGGLDQTCLRVQASEVCRNPDSFTPWIHSNITFNIYLCNASSPESWNSCSSYFDTIAFYHNAPLVFFFIISLSTLFSYRWIKVLGSPAGCVGDWRSLLQYWYNCRICPCSKEYEPLIKPPASV